MAFESLSQFASKIGEVTSSDAFTGITQGLDVLAGYNTLVGGQALQNTAFEVQLQANANAEVAALTAFQANTIAEQYTLAESLQAVRLQLNAVVGEQRAQLAARGLSSGRTALELLNDTVTRATRTAADIRLQAENSRRVQELGLNSTLNQIRARQAGIQIQQKQAQREARRRRRESVPGILSGLGSIAKGASGLLDLF